MRRLEGVSERRRIIGNQWFCGRRVFERRIWCDRALRLQLCFCFLIWTLGFHGLNQLGHICRNEICSIQSGMVDVSPHQMRFPPKCSHNYLQSPHCLPDTTSTNNSWMMACKLYILSLTKFWRGTEKMMESDIVLAYVHTDSTLVIWLEHNASKVRSRSIQSCHYVLRSKVIQNVNADQWLMIKAYTATSCTLSTFLLNATCFLYFVMNQYLSN